MIELKFFFHVVVAVVRYTEGSDFQPPQKIIITNNTTIFMITQFIDLNLNLILTNTLNL